MAKCVSERVKIKAIATAIPDNRIGHKENVLMFGEDVVDRFEKSSGILHTYKTAENQTASDLGYVAAKHILDELNIDKEKIGVLVFVSPATDYRQPATACVLQHRLGLSNDCAALDSTHGCSAFPYGQQIVTSIMGTSDSEYGLLIVGDTNSKLVKKSDHSYMLASDSSSAILYEKCENNTLHTILKTYGDGFRDIIIPAGGMRDLNAEAVDVVCSDGVVRNKYDWYMNGMNVFAFATRYTPKVIREYLEWTKSSLDKYDVIAFHQANGIIVERMRKILGLKEDKVLNSLEQYGNTGGNSLLLAICDKYGAVDKCKLNIFTAAFGVGLSIGVSSFEIEAEYIYPIIRTTDYYSEGIINLSIM